MASQTCVFLQLSPYLHLPVLKKLQIFCVCSLLGIRCFSGVPDDFPLPLPFLLLVGVLDALFIAECGRF